MSNFAFVIMRTYRRMVKIIYSFLMDVKITETIFQMFILLFK